MRKRRLPVGAELLPQGGAHFRVWAPASQTVAVILYPQNGGTESRRPLAPESDGYFAGVVEEACAGGRYRYELDSGRFPDPASRFQPEGPHGPSELVAPEFAWTDSAWRGRAASELVLYELHLGTFTAAGTWRAAMEHLSALAGLGVTMLEIMPIADFPGRFGWGYDGVNLFAPAHRYGRPDDARAFINRAHELGLAVILDVVCNHLGPDGNYLPQYSTTYFSGKYTGEWGDPINFDDTGSGPVREFYQANARHWVDEYHFDGLRLDATQQIFDATRPSIIAEIARAARAAAPGRRIFVLGENEPQQAELLRPVERGGCGLDALWNDDFHHAAVVAATGRAEAYYRDYRGTAQEFVSMIKYGYLYQGQRSAWQGKRRGTAAFDLGPQRFAVYLQNHDQIANSLHGRRLHQLTGPAQLRALTAVLLLAPQIPLLFQGQEFAASSPFRYFADHTAELRDRVAVGRRGFLSQFGTIATPEAEPRLPLPHAPETFADCKLDWSEWREHGEALALHGDLLRVRREELATRFSQCDGAVLADAAFVIRYFAADGDDRLLVVNLGVDHWLNPAPEPLLAPRPGHGWRIRWSSESVDYGGSGTTPLETTANWILPGNTAVLLAPDHHDDPPAARLGEKD